MNISFFRSYKHKKFTYNPLYYNEQKENLEERIRKIEREVNGSGNEHNYYPGNIKGSFQHLRSLRSKSQRSSSIRIIIIAAILIAIVYIIFGL